MFKKIEELWPELLRPRRSATSELEEPLLGGDDAEQDGGPTIEVDEEQILEAYRNQYWTRVIKVTEDDDEGNRKWPLGRDIPELLRLCASPVHARQTGRAGSHYLAHE